MIYLFDENEKLFKILKKESLKSADQTYSLTTENYVSDRLTVETKGMNAGEVEKAHFMAIQSLEDRHKFHYFYIARKETDKTTILEGVQSGIEELRKTPVYDKRPRNLSARNVIEDLLRDTNWIPRFVADTSLKNTNLYYTSVFEALKKVCKVWGLEMQFFVEMNGNQIGARFIDFKKKIGEATGKRVVYGHNALKILSESESTNLFTALIGRGKGEQVSSAEENESGQAGYGRKINFEEIILSKSKGNPVDKPAGQKFVEIPEMTAKYGILNADGTRRPKIGFIDFGEEEDREALLQQTYEALKDSSRPQLTLKTSSVYLKNVAIGDTIRVVRHDRKLDYETRIFEITINRINNKSTDIKLGDRTSQSNEAKIQSAADKAVEEFIEGGFNDFVNSIPDLLPSADGFNQNWYSEEDPTVTHPKKVMIGDIWYKPDPEHEGHKIMLRWTGEMWEEILRTYNAERLKEQIAAEMAEVNASMKNLDDELKSKVAELFAKAGVAEESADEAKRLAEKAGTDLIKERERSNLAIQGALTEARRLDQEERKATEAAILAARNKANDEARRLISLSERALQESINELSTEFTKTNDAIKLKADKSTVDNLTGKVSQAEATLRVQAGEIASRVKTADFDKEKEKLRTAETNIRQLGDRVTQEISRTVAKIPNSFGLRNLILKSADFGNPHKENGPRTTVIAQDGYWQIRSEGYTSNAWGGTAFNLSLDTLRAEEDYSFYTQVYIDSTDRAAQIDSGFTISFKDHVFNKTVFSYSLPTNVKNRWIDVAFSFRPTSDLEIKENGYELFIFLTKNGLVRVKPPILVKGKLIPNTHVLAPEDLTSEIENVKTTITNTAEGVEQLSTRVAQTEGKSSRQETQIHQLIGDVSSKVSRTDYDNLKRTVDGHTTEMRQTKESINLKADRTLVTTVQTAATEAKSLASSANSKADSATTKANQADSKASSASTKADSASTKADSAVNTANQASQKATSAESKANGATAKAEDAEKKSAEALGKSVDALAKAGLVDAKAADALAKAIQNSQSISRAQAELQVANEAINAKVSKVDFDLVTRKLATAETQITTIAGQISEKLSRTEVNSLIDGKGFITNSTFTNTIDKTERGMIARIAQVETKIPTEIGSRNYIRGSLQMRKGSGDWGDNSFRHSGPGSSTTIDISDFPTKDISKAIKLTGQGAGIAQDNFEISEGAWTLSYWVKGAVGTVVRLQAYWSSDNNSSGVSQVITLESAEWTRLSFKAHNSIAGKVSIGYIYLQSGTEVLVTAPKLEKGDVLTDHSPAPEDFATTIALHEVRDTVDGHTRTLTAQGRSISQVTQTAEGIVSRVANTESSLTRLDGRANFVESALNSTKTEVSQLAGSWAVRNLTSSGTVLNQLNLNRDGSVKIDGKLVQITGQTYIQDGVITSAKIGNLDAGKITTGTLNAARVNLINLDASKITTGSLDARFIRGRQLASLNGATRFDLQNGELNFMTNSPAIRRVVAGLPNQFVRFATGFESSDGTFSNLYKRRTVNSNVSSASFGVNRSGWEVTNTGSFTGINVFASGPAQGDNVVDRIGIHSDILVVSHNTIEGQRGWIFENWVPDVNQKRLYTMRPMHNDHVNYKAYIGTSEYPIDDMFALEITLGGHRLRAILKDLANRVGHNGWANDFS